MKLYLKKLAPIVVLWFVLLAVLLVVQQYNIRHGVKPLDIQLDVVGTVASIDGDTVIVTADPGSELQSKQVKFSLSGFARAPEVLVGDRVMATCRLKTDVTEPQGAYLVNLVLLPE